MSLQDLLQAVGTSDTKAVKDAIAAGVDVNGRKGPTMNFLNVPMYVTTPLHAAVTKATTNVMALLLDAGADITIVDYDGDSVLHNAVRCRIPETVQFLLSRGADINARGHYGFTPLTLAVSIDRLSIVQCLVQNGADVNIQSDDGYTALHYACEYDLTDCIYELLAHGARADMKDHRGLTPVDLCTNKDTKAIFTAGSGTKGAGRRQE